jgi:acyl-CoA synthetase (AMP-forming)/AMP-acid ligase II
LSSANVVGLLHAAAARAPDRAALVLGAARAPSQRVRFAELVRRAGAVAAGLERRGVRPGDRVVVFVPMSGDLYAALIGVLQIGAAAVFVDPWVGWRRIAAFAALAEPRAFLGTPRSHLLRLADARLRRVRLAVTTGSRCGPLPAPCSLAELLAEPPSAAVGERGAEDPALVTFTTGSSGLPKGANRTHGFLAAQHRALAAEFPLGDEDVELTTFPVFSLHNLASGIPTVVPPVDLRRVSDFDPAPVLDLMASEGVTTCTTSPPFIDRLVAGLDGAGVRPRLRLRRVLTGGAPVGDEQLRSWSRAFPGVEIVVAYGSTEAEPVAHVTSAERLEARSELRPRSPGYCLGRPVAGARVKVLRLTPDPIVLGDGDWTPWEVEPGAIGELAVTGAHVCKTYFRSPEAERATKIVDRRGEVWHRMGDTVYRDGQGRLWLAGRLHSTIRRAGEHLHPQLVEQAARGEDARLRRVAAVGLPDRELGERLAIVLETADGAAPEVVAQARARLRSAGFPDDSVFVAARPLPLDPRHRSKIDYPRLRADLARGRHGAPL